MKGMHAQTGKVLNGMKHLEQSIKDILSTPIGTRIMRRSYGSRLMYLLDQPVNENLVATIQVAITEALGYYEPRLKLSQVAVNDVAEGRIDFTIEGHYLPDNRIIRLENLTIQ